MITSNILYRVLKVTVAGGSGTAFTIEVDGSQYLVTAKHVLPPGARVTMDLQFNDLRTTTVTLDRLDADPPDADVSVLVLPTPITQTYPVIPDCVGMIFSQDMYFLGYPYGLAHLTEMPRGSTTWPFVKKGILSAAAPTPSGVAEIFLDGSNNPGFSGGPVVFVNHDTGALHVAGVVSGYRTDRQPVRVADQITEAFILANSGIVVATNISHAVDAINRHLASE